MGSKVELINNPYTQRLRILINGEAVSVYSNLEKFMDEPFSYWCDRILDAIYEECNGDLFSLHFSSRQEELEIMEKLAQNDPHCVQYISSPLLRPTPLSERMKALNMLLKRVRSTAFHTYTKQALFIIPESMKGWKEDLLGLEVRNAFCEIMPKVVFYQDYMENPEDADIIFVLSIDRPVEECAKKLNLKRDFGILIGDRTGFDRKIGDMFLYKAREDAVFETIFNCLLLAPLLEVFCSCIRSLSPEIVSEYKAQIEELQSTSLRVVPVVEKNTVEVGRSSRIQFKTDLKGYEVRPSDLHFTYSERGIINCNGLAVEGLKPGKAVLNIFLEGEMTPSASVEYTVILRNRITEIKLEDDALVLGEGDGYKLAWSYLPANADNVESVEWKSDNPEVVAVDKRGYLRAVKKGVCTIWCYAEQVSARCRCTVKPYLQAIITDCKEIDMVYGKERELGITLRPENCVDSELMISSMDMRTVNVVGRTLKAIGIGSTKVVIQNKRESVRADVLVHVMSEKDYEKRQKQKEGDGKPKEKKKWLSRLLGK